MRTLKVRIPVGRTIQIQEVELYTTAEAKEILKGKEWDMDIDIFSLKQPNKRVGWLAKYPDGDGIFVEAI